MSELSLLFKDRMLSTHPLNPQEDCIIGHAPDCNIHIDSLAVSPRHAKIVYSGTSYMIEALDNESKILVNNKIIKSSTNLSDGDIISVGKHTLIFVFNEDQENHLIREPEPTHFKPHGTGWIQYLNGSKMGETLQIKQSMVNISDEKGKNIALISNRTDGFYLSYLKGDKPTKVNNIPIGENSTPLENNNTVSVGTLELLFYIT